MTTNRDRLMKILLLQSILRGWRPLIEPPPLLSPPQGRSALLLLLLLEVPHSSTTPVSQGADETGVLGAVAWTKLSAPSCLCRFRCCCRCRCIVRVVLAILRMQV